MKVKFKFAYYWKNSQDKWEPSYLVMESNSFSFAVGSNISRSTLKAMKIKIPPTPRYTEWVKKGKPIFRGIFNAK